MHPSAHVLLVAALCAAATAQTTIGGSIYDGSGGPLLSGVVYHVSGNLHVPAGQTLTLQAGAIVKFDAGAFAIDGTLRCNGTAAQPVFFTSVHDDAAGGDTNHNGTATTPAPTQWFGLRFSDTADASRLTRTFVRYTGYGYWPSIEFQSADVTATDCTFSDGSWGGMRLSGNARPTITRCAIQRIDNSPAVYGASILAVPGFHDNTASGCPSGNYLRIDSGAVTGQLTLSPDNAIGGALVLNDNLNVPSGATLTLNPGVVVKSWGLAVSVDGTLHSNGTAVDPVVLTSILDDAAGGDTNGDGNASQPGPTQWLGLRFTDTADASTLTHTIVRYTGYGYWPAIDLQAADITATDCTFTDAGWGGMHVDTAARPAVTRCGFARIHNRPAIYGLAINAVPGFADNTATSCPGGPFQRVDQCTVAGQLTLDPTDFLNGALVYNDNLTVPNGATLTLNPGTVLKPTTGLIVTVDGTLHSNGTLQRPVVMTSFPDDAAGGDTNGDGNASVPGPTQWLGVRFTDTSDASTMTHTIVRYAGWSYLPAIDLIAADVTLTDCSFTDSSWGGMQLDIVARPTVTRCAFERIQNRPAVYGLDIAAVPGFTDCTAAGGTGGDFIRIDNTVVTGNVAIGANNQIGGALVYNNNLIVPAGAGLTLLSGVVLKPTGGVLVDVSGRLDVRGPVVFTSLDDDAYGGDTNGNGNATSPGVNQWLGLRLQSTATGTIDLAIVRYAGYAYLPAVDCASATVYLKRSRVEHCGWGGFKLTDAGAADDLVAFAIGGDGFLLDGGAFPVRRCTSAYNSGKGFVLGQGFNGRVRSSIAWGNGTIGFVAMPSADIAYCDGTGLSLSAGNKNVDPRFVGAAAGDLRLQPGSQCIDTGDPSDRPVGRDPLGFPRYLDGDLNGAQRVDMGAFEYDNVLLLATGNPTPGGSVTFTSISTASVPLGLMVLGVESPAGLPLFNFGNLYIDLAGPFVSTAWPTNGSVSISVPATITTPVTLGFQLVGLGNPFPRGNTSNPVFLTIR